MHLARGNAAKRQPRGELTAEIEPEESVARVFVPRHGATGEKVEEASVAGSGAAGEGMRGLHALRGHLGRMLQSKGGVEGFVEGLDDRVEGWWYL